MARHNHQIKDLAVYDRATIVQNFGHTVSASLPQHPERRQITIERVGSEPVSVALTALPCGCAALIHAAHAESLRAADLEAQLTDILRPTKTGEHARVELARLRDAAGHGQPVTPHELAAALELVELADAADAEAAADAAELNAAVLADATDAVAGEHRDRLEESAIRLRTLQNGAYRAFVDLLDAAEDHERLAEMAANSMEVATGEPVAIRRGKLGVMRSLNLNGNAVEWWSAQSWAAGLLAAVDKRHRLIGRSRFDRSELPRVYPSDPRPTIE